MTQVPQGITSSLKGITSSLKFARFDISGAVAELSGCSDQECLPTVLENVNKARRHLLAVLGAIYAEEYALRLLEKDIQRLIEEAAQ